MSEDSNKPFVLPTIGVLLSDLEKALVDRQIPSARLEARILLGHVLGLETASLLSNSQTTITADKSRQCEAMLRRRLQGEPIFRIIGEREFYGRNFKLNKDTLEPRADTETLVDAVLKESSNLPENARFLDLGSGTGCIAISLLCEKENWQATASDINQNALLAVEENSKAHGVFQRCKPVQSDWFENIDGQYDFIVSNPPYIPSHDIEMLEVEVKEHDPKRALDGGVDGLDFYRRLFSQAKRFLKSGGFLFLEFGHNQGSSLMELANRETWLKPEIHRDLAGLERVFVCQKPLKT